MLNVGPWNRLPLIIHWLKQEYYMQFPVNRNPPVHMPFAYGAIKMEKSNATKEEDLKPTICAQNNADGSKKVSDSTDEAFEICQECNTMDDVSKT